MRDPVGYGNYSQGWENNLAVRLENTGSEAVINPWITVNGRNAWRSVEEILAGIVDDDMSAAEKARAIWEFARRHRYHSTTADDEVKDTVKMLNVYGYTLCWDEAYTVSNLWQAAGLRTRRGHPHGHCTTEVYYDGGYHLLDSDEHLLYLLRDNATIASEQDLARDHDLVKRGHAYGILNREQRQTAEQAASLFVHDGLRAGTRPFLAHHRMDCVLRPGEALIWEWEDRGKYHGYGRRPPRLANGRMCYAPRLDATFGRWTEHAANLEAADTGLEPADPTQPAVLVYRLSAPYVIVGGRIDGAAGWAIELSRDGGAWAPVSSGQLDPVFSPDSRPAYDCLIRLRALGRALTDLVLEIDLQMAPLALPALAIGANAVCFTHTSDGPRPVRITHEWLERDDLMPPPAPARPLSPIDGAAVDGTQPTLAWEPVPAATDYEFRLSGGADMRYALSPVFEKLVSRTPSAGTAEWRVPEAGLLNPDTIYYWQVRARGDEGLWSPWSCVWSFTPRAPAPPAGSHVTVDWASRRMVLHWEPPKSGAVPAHYEIHGSNERGFTARSETHCVFRGRDAGHERVPSTLLATTPNTELAVVGADTDSARGNRAYYRVVAVDQKGRRSGPSDYVAVPRPFIWSMPPARAVAGELTTYALRVVRSTGELRCLSDGPQRYLSAMRDGDVLHFILDEGPAFIALDPSTGVLTAAPETHHLGFHTVTVRVQNGQGGADVRGFDLEVVP